MHAPTVAGSASWRRRFTIDARRQAMSGPAPISASSASPSGMFTRVKNGGSTATFVPRTSSAKIGYTVPTSTEHAIPTSSRLLKRKPASRLTGDSSVASAVSSGSRAPYSAKLVVPAAMRKNTKA